MSTRRTETEFLAHAGRLLLEYNEATGTIHRALKATARAMTGEICHVAVAYGGVSVAFEGHPPAFQPAHELRYNMAVLAGVHAILDEVHQGLPAEPARASLEKIESETPRHPRWLAVVILGIAAACLTLILRGDHAAAAVVGTSTGLGLVARQELGRRRFSVLTLPLAAALLGAICGGLAIRHGWTVDPELVLIVPSLMLVPGPHLINGLLDLIENHIPMGLARLTLAAAILLASALGIIVGIRLTLAGPPTSGESVLAIPLNLASDMILAGIVTCGFAVFYNAAWLHVGLSAVGGMVGHGMRFLALEQQCPLEVATFVGSLAVGAISARLARRDRLPFAAIAFAGAVTMMPGLHMFRTLAGALQIARSGGTTEFPVVAGTIGSAVEASLVVGGLVLGILLGARLASSLARNDRSGGPSA